MTIGTLTTSAAKAEATRRDVPKFTGMAAWTVLAVVVSVLVLLPLFFVFNTALLKESRFGLSSQYSLSALIHVYTSSEYLSALGSTLILASLVTTFALLMGVTAAVLVTRTTLARKSAFHLLMIMPIFLSPFNGLISWVALGSEKTGFLNTLFAWVLHPFGLETGPIVNIWSYSGIVWVMFLFFTPYAYLFTAGSLSSMDSSLEEAARVSGADPIWTLRKVTLPMSLPSILAAGLLIFILSSEMYTIPGIIGTNIGYEVLQWRIFKDMLYTPVHQAQSAAAGTMLLFITIMGVLLQRRITRNSDRYVTIGGKGRKGKLMELGRWKWPALALLIAYISLATLIPLATLVLTSLQKFTSPTLDPDVFTLRHYHDFFTIPSVRVALSNTVILAICSGLLCVAIGFVISYGEVRLQKRIPRFLGLVCALPVAVPGVVYGIGVYWAYLRTPIYGTIFLLLLAFVAKFLPYGVLVSRSGIMQVHKELEQCARTCGAGPARVLVSITAPLLSKTLTALLFFIMLLSIKELSASVLLYSEQSRVLSVLTWQYSDQGNFQFAAAVGVIQTLLILLLVFGVRFAMGMKLESTMGKRPG